MWENNHAEEAKEGLGWKHTRNPNNSQRAKEAAQTYEKTPGHAAQDVLRVRGKVVDYIRYSIDDGVLCMNACFRDKTPLFRQFPSHSKSSSSYLTRRDPTEPEVPGDPIGLGDCCAVAGCSLILYQKKHGPAQESSGPCRCRAGVFS